MTTNGSTDLTSRVVKYVKTCFSFSHLAGRASRDPQDPVARDRQDPVAKEHILQEIRRTAEANGGRPLGRGRFLRETGIRQCDFLGRFWTSWGDAVREAGYAPNQFQVSYPDAFLLEKYAEVIRSLGRIPSHPDLLMIARSDKTLPDPSVFGRRFGSKPALLAKVAEHCRSREALHDVAGLCELYLSSLRPSLSLDRPGPASSDNAFGFVYLLQPGRFFKIGRSNDAGRRVYELALRLPEPVRSVHIIATDDPPGIEAYWHKRFARKRKNGEWFQLDSRDVAAFKRRKFM